MAFGLKKADADRREGYVKDLNEKWLAVLTAVEAYNERTTALFAEVETAVTAYNEALGEARGFVEDQASDQRGQFDDKSEKWQESDRGQAVGEHIESWENIALEDIEATKPDDLEIEDPGHADELEGLSADPEY